MALQEPHDLMPSIRKPRNASERFQNQKVYGALIISILAPPQRLIFELADQVNARKDKRETIDHSEAANKHSVRQAAVQGRCLAREGLHAPSHSLHDQHCPANLRPGKIASSRCRD